jgi:hypothetical protein
MHNISNLFYFGTTLYMFQTVFPSIIRSLSLYVQHEVNILQVLWLLASSFSLIYFRSRCSFFPSEWWITLLFVLLDCWFWYLYEIGFVVMICRLLLWKLVLGYAHRPALSFVANEISRNKVVVPEGAAGLNQIISVSWVFIYAELLCCAIRHDLILFIFLFYFWWFLIVYWIILVGVYLWFNFLYDSLFVPWGVVVVLCSIKSWFCLSYLVYQGSLNFIIHFYFPILKELIIYVSYCFISINNRLLVVTCYSSLVFSGFSRNEFNSRMLFNFCCWFYCFLFDIKIKGD